MQPNQTAHHRQPPVTKNTLTLFYYLPVGAVFEYHGDRAVKITPTYFFIDRKIVNALRENDGALLNVNGGLCVLVLEDSQ